LLHSAELGLYAASLDDVERARIATGNRLGALTRSIDQGGHGLPPERPEVQRIQQVLDHLLAVEHGVELDLKRAMRAHPLNVWRKARKGVGEKQLARLLHAIGDPAWNAREDRLRRGPAELWRYCGFDPIHPGQMTRDTHASPAGVDPIAVNDHRWSAARPSPVVDGDLSGTTTEDHRRIDAHPRGVQGDRAGLARTRMKGVKANWSGAGKMRALLIAGSCVNQRCMACRAAGKERKANGDEQWAPPPASCTCVAGGFVYRAVYDSGRLKYRDATHSWPCPGCGPKYEPAEVGSPLSEKHKDQRALRLTAKAILKDLWVEARRIRAAMS
jgi:hypothetical protein